MKLLTNVEGSLYVAIFNAGEEDRKVSVALNELEIYNEVTGYELWSGFGWCCIDKRI